MGGWLALIRHWKLAALVVVAFIFGLLRLRAQWVSAALDRARAERDALQRYKDTRQEIDHAPHGNDPDAARRWLYERGRDGRP